MKYCLLYESPTERKVIKGYASKLEKKLNENSLQDIVEFTNSFNSEDELTEFLFYNNLIDTPYNGTFQIGCFSKNAIVKILPYGISYKRDAKFFNYDRLSNFYISHLTDPKFMDAFLDKFYNYLIDTPYYTHELLTIKDNYQFFLKNNILPINSQKAMADFIIRYTLKRNNNQITRNFTKLRELAMFVIDYIRNNELRVKPIMATNEDIEDINIQIKHYETLLKEDLPDEVKEAYQSAIKNLEHSLLIIDSSKERRRK